MAKPFDKRSIFRYLKHGYIPSLKENNFDQEYPPPAIPLNGISRPNPQGELWSVFLWRISFSKLLPSLQALDPRSYLIEISPSRIQEEDVKAILSDFPGLFDEPRRVFIIAVNADNEPAREGVEIGPERWLTQAELCLLGIAHEIHYLETHHDLRLIHEDIDVYEGIGKEAYGTPIDWLDYNLLCSMCTLAGILRSIEQVHGFRYFTTQLEYLIWRSLDEPNRRGWGFLTGQLRDEKYISMDRASQEFPVMFKWLIGRIPRLPNGDINLDQISSVEENIDLRSHALRQSASERQVPA